MSCDGEERKTFENTRRLADMAKRLTGIPQTIYRPHGKTVYEFCESASYTDERGEFVADVR